MKARFPDSGIRNQVAEVRKRRGWSAVQLANAVGVSRQAIYSIEAGTYVPNTLLTLQLAHALEVGAEELFRLKHRSQEPGSKSAKANLIPQCAELRPGQAVQLARVDGRLFAVVPAPSGWYLPASDAVVSTAPPSRGLVPRRGRVNVRLHQTEDVDDRLLIAGCDPAMSILQGHLQRAGFQTVLVHQNSSQAITLLKNESVHVAGTHLRDPATGEANIPAVGKAFRRGDVTVVTFATWQEGLITARGNPKKIKSIEDLARKRMRFVNREQGAATRLLLDNTLSKLKMNPKQMRGYAWEAPGHLAAALEVSSERADCCIATEAAARAFGLFFEPLQTARYDLVIRKPHLKLPAIRTLLDTLADAQFRRALSAAAGYDTAATGTRVL